MTRSDVPKDLFQHSPGIGEGFVMGEGEEQRGNEGNGMGEAEPHRMSSLPWSDGPGRVRGHQVEVTASEFHVSICH